MPEPVIFISYSRKDNTRPPGATDDEGRGFVEHLRGRLRYDMETDLGGGSPALWFDRVYAPDGAPYRPRLQDGMQKALMLVIVLSENWLGSPNCRPHNAG